MPTMTTDSVKTLPIQSRSAMTLEELRDAMADSPPSLEGFKGGWANIDDHQSNLRLAGVEPPRSVPSLKEATEDLPRRLMARFYYWDAAPARLRNQPGHDPLTTRFLNAIDVIVTEPAASRFGFLLSTRTPGYLGGPGGILAALTELLRSKDETIKIDRRSSHLSLADEEIFLWLAVQNRDNPQLDADILLDKIAGISSRDQAHRTADLRYGVDFERSNFLTAVAEKDTLGPIDICFVQHVGEHNHSYEVRLHIDGGFEIRKKNLHFPDSLDRPDLMLDTSLFLAFSMIPRLNSLYVADSTQWRTQRIEVIHAAIEALETRYKSLKAVLQGQLDGQAARSQ